MTELLAVGGIVALAVGYLFRTIVLRRKNACAKCALHEIVDKKR